MRNTLTAVAVTVLALACAGTAGAAEYTATTYDELNDALDAAAKHAGDDTIRLAAGTYDVSRSVEIDDASGKVTIVGAGARATTLHAHGEIESPRRGIVVRPGSRAEITDLSITGAYGSGDGNVDGPALFVEEGGTAVVARAHIYGNTSLDFGGAIANRGTLTIDSSLIEGNTAQEAGGGIASWGTLKVVNSTFTGNKVGSSFNPQGSLGGAIDAIDGDATVERSTITGNQTDFAGGGIAVEAGADATVQGSIISGNTVSDCDGPITSGGHNVTSCGFGSPVDPQLGALADNGGPTDTFALVAGSPALDQGGDCPTTDQRGFARSAGTCDIGAFELGGEPPQETTTPPVTQPPGGGTVTPVIGGGQAPASCADKAKPFTTLKSAGVKHSGKAITLRGKSRDAAGQCPSGLARVQVSLARVSGTELNCRFLRQPNRFVLTPFRNCRKPILFTARGTAKWSFKFPVHLAPGKYRAQARGWDKAGNKETPTKGRNIVYFTVR